MTASADICTRSEDVATLTEGAFVRFPPHRRHIWIPLAPAKASGLALTMYTASKPLPLLLLRAIWAGTRIGGGRILPGPREHWTPPMSPDALAELCAQWRAAISGPVDGFALYERIQQNRQGFIVMVSAGGRSMLVRVRPDTGSVDRERAVSERAAELKPGSFRVPQLRGSGSVQDWRWLGYEVMGSRPHAPVRRIDRRLTDDVTALVEATVPRPADVPEHWRGCHGDLNPWNLRRCGRSTWLIDWEDAGWAPPGADEVYFAAVRTALGSGDAKPLTLPREFEEARRYWARTVADRAREDQSDPRLSARLTTALADPR